MFLYIFLSICQTRLAVGGDASHGAKDEPALEAFTPAFTYSAFKYVEVSYTGADSVPLPVLSPPDASSLTCYRIGVGFDWVGDVAVAAPAPPLPAASLPLVAAGHSALSLVFGCLSWFCARDEAAGGGLVGGGGW